MPERHLKAVPDPDRPPPAQPPLIDEPPQRPARRICAWCDQPAITTIMISPPEFVGRKGRRVLRRSATWANACREHRRHAYNPYAQPALDRAEARRLKLAADQRAKDQLTIDDALEPGPEKPAS